MSCEFFTNDNKVQSKVNLVEDVLEIISNGTETVKIDIKDIIVLEEGPSKNNTSSSATVHYIQKKDSPKWRKEIIKLTSVNQESENILTALKNKVEEDFRNNRPKKLFVIINPIGGMKNGEQIFRDTVQPMFKLAGIKTDVIVSQHHKHVEEITERTDFSPYDGVVVMGGDGTYYQCMHVLLRKRQEEEGINYDDPANQLKEPIIPIGVIPTGSGNAVAQIAHGCWDVETSTLHIIRGRVTNIGAIGLYSEGKCLGFAGLAIVFGWWAEMFTYMEKHRWLKAHRYRYVPIYYCMLKKKHIFDAEIKVTERSKRDQSKDENELTQMKGDWNSYSGRISSLTFFVGDFLTEDDKFGDKPIDFDSSLLTVYKETGRRVLLNHHLNMIYVREPTLFKKDYIINKKIYGFKIRLDPVAEADSFFSRIASIPQRIMLDGESIYTSNREWEARFLGKIMPVFCSADAFGNLTL